MKWAITTQYWPVREQPYRGHSAYQTLRRLIDRVELQAFAPQSRYPDWLLPKNRPWARTDSSFQIADIPTTFFDYPALPVLSRILNGDVCAQRLQPFIEAWKPDLLVSYWVYPDAYAAVRVGRRLGIPVVTIPIGTDLNRSLTGLTRFFTSWTLRHSDAVLPVSRNLGRTASELTANEANVIPILNGCDTNVFYPRSKAQARESLGLDQQELSVLYVGRLDILKGLMELVRAVSQLSSLLPALRLTLVGEGPARSTIEKLAEELNFQQKLRLVPPCPSTRVSDWMNAADVFALPSYAEGCPNVVVEALNCGRPVVATNVGGIPELIDDSKGILVSSRDWIVLSKALEQALNTTWDHELIATNSRRSWEDTAKEMYDICGAVIRGHSNAAVGARYETSSSR